MQLQTSADQDRSERVVIVNRLGQPLLTMLDKCGAIESDTGIRGRGRFTTLASVWCDDDLKRRTARISRGLMRMSKLSDDWESRIRLARSVYLKRSAKSSDPWLKKLEKASENFREPRPASNKSARSRDWSVAVGVGQSSFINRSRMSDPWGRKIQNAYKQLSPRRWRRDQKNSGSFMAEPHATLRRTAPHDGYR